MEGDLLSVKQAAGLLGVTAPTLYDWLGQSDRGLLRIRGNRVTVDYLQGGSAGHGKICIAVPEIERLRNLMRVVPRAFVPRRVKVVPQTFPGITVALGRPRQ